MVVIIVPDSWGSCANDLMDGQGLLRAVPGRWGRPIKDSLSRGPRLCTGFMVSQREDAMAHPFHQGFESFNVAKRSPEKLVKNDDFWVLPPVNLI